METIPAGASSFKGSDISTWRMLMRAIRIATVGALLVPVTGCNTPVGLDGVDAPAVESHSAAIVMVPFRAQVVAQVTDVQSCVGDAPRFFAHGEGTGTHLGRFTTDYSFCGRGATLDGGEGTFVAANGDVLHFTFQGVSDEAFPIIHFTSFVTFAGGTGRFENATGTATVHGSFDLTTGSGPTDWEGVISAVGS
jgi:hypothetical protein